MGIAPHHASLASLLAAEFNSRIRRALAPTRVPELEFLSCSVLLIGDPEWPGGKRGVLVERMLDTDRYAWTKWNSNAGAVDGKIAHVPLDVDRELAVAVDEFLGTVQRIN